MDARAPSPRPRSQPGASWPAWRAEASLAHRGDLSAAPQPDFATMLAIYESGHTRIPIFRRSTGSAAPRCAGESGQVAKWSACSRPRT